MRAFKFLLISATPIVVALLALAKSPLAILALLIYYGIFWSDYDDRATQRSIKSTQKETCQPTKAIADLKR